MNRVDIKVIVLIVVLIGGGALVRYMQNEEIKIEQEKNREEESSHTITVGDKKLFVEIARTTEERARGLMHRPSLEENNGMLFVFSENPRVQRFWNQNTLIPLDIIWVRDNKIIGIDFLPAIDQTSVIVESPDIADHVIEVNAGWSVKNNINVNDVVTF